MSVLVCYPKLTEAKRLADLAGIRDDLEQIQGYLDILDQQIARNYREYYVWEAITAAIATAYGRCFNEGVRERLPHTLLNSAPSAVRATHDYLIDLRNKHVAHSVNEYEHNYLVVRLSYEAGRPVGISDVSVQTSRFIPISDRELPGVRGLVGWVRASVDAAFEAERAKIMDVLSSADLEQLSLHRSEPFIDVLDPKANSRKRSTK